MNDIFVFMLSYSVVIGIAFFLIQFLTNGFLTIFLKVKASRGKKVLINVRSYLQHYYIAGEVVAGQLVYRDKEAKKDNRKTVKRVVIPPQNSFYRILNVNCINVDEEKSCVITPDNLRGVPGFDAIKWSNLLKRSLMSVKVKDESILMIVILLAVILLLLVQFVLFSKISGLETLINTIQTNTIITGGNV